jgi:hypothetical protein
MGALAIQRRKELSNMGTPPTFDEQLNDIGEAAERLVESVKEAKRVRAAPASSWASKEEWQVAMDDTFANVGSALAEVVAFVPPLR